MRVREWIEALEGMDPEQEVRAMNLLGDWIEVAPVQGSPVVRQPNRRPPAGATLRPFVKIVREDDSNPQPWARW